MRILLLLSLFLLPLKSISQTIRAEDRYGNQLYFVDGPSLKAQDRYGEVLIYFEEQQLKLGSRYGSRFIISTKIH